MNTPVTTLRSIARLDRPGACRLAAMLCLLTVVTLGVGCMPTPFVDTERARQLAALPYPEAQEHGPEVDVLVQRERGRVRLINRSPHSFENVQLWLNQQYVVEVDTIAIGTDNRIALAWFINRYQEPFPTAGLLTPDRAETVSAAELYDPATQRRYRLTVMPEQRERLGER
ncbi:MAG: hypothetical protein WD118_12120 [Phycisphaeraceae bacterium]